MIHTLLDEYARLLTIDTRACADLFSTHAQYRTRLGSHDLCFRGRAEISRFLRHVPRQISFRAARCEPDGSGYQGELALSAADLGRRRQHVRFQVEDGRFTRFEVLQPGNGGAVIS
jgi:hypothetical protein